MVHALGETVTLGPLEEEPTAMEVPVKASAGILPDTVSGAVKVVATCTQLLLALSQY